MALPHATLPAGNRRQLIGALRELCRAEEVTTVVVGVPVGLSGVEGAAAVSARSFGASLGKALGLPVQFVDERLSSREAARATSQNVDAAAAALILDTYLGQQSRP